MPSDSNYIIKPSPRLLRDLKHIKNKHFKLKIVDIVYHKIAKYPYACFPEGHGLPGIRYWKFTQNGTYYRIAYNIRNNQIILVLMAGSHENFYVKLKQYLKNSSWIKNNK